MIVVSITAWLSAPLTSTPVKIKSREVPGNKLCQRGSPGTSSALFSKFPGEEWSKSFSGENLKVHRVTWSECSIHCTSELYLLRLVLPFCNIGRAAVWHMWHHLKWLDFPFYSSGTELGIMNFIYVFSAVSKSFTGAPTLKNMIRRTLFVQVLYTSRPTGPPASTPVKNKPAG